jgi:hypothetical protein
MEIKYRCVSVISVLIFFSLSADLAGMADTSVYKRNIVIAGVGDIMLGSSFPSTALLPPHDNPMLLLGDLADTLASADVTFGNLEGSFLDAGNPVKKCRDTTRCYLFRMPERYAGTLAASGFDILSLANNHFGDFGPAARSKTMQLLDSLGICYGGLLEYPWSVFTKDSLKYGFCAFAPNAGTLSIIDLEKAGETVQMLSDSCDIVIVSFHGGAEGADYQRTPKTEELFVGENRGDVHKFARAMIDSGADVVFGHGPHVTRAIEVYNERFIGYSLGNFCTYGKFNILGPNGIAPIIKLNVDTTGKFLSGRIIPVFQTKTEGVRIDTAGRVIKKIRELTELDFPDSVIDISDEGEISYK